ncbi:hypothetical protein N3K66_007112 [Trichothecium roseum]|uniref:Uncharacterized protein n=1 Tax=Trichothecium roseum TaxID=47278 RepID=A0ACC0UXA7_9HYPO|nr:hypothetical protein N3K66_007112 [Trichothecium roseum]
MKAIQVIPPGKTLGVLTDLPVPALRDGYCLVKVSAVALNPTDWKHVDYGAADPGSTVGCEYAGVVVAVGRGGAAGFREGDRIAGLVRGSDRTNHENGAFAEYLVAKAALQFRIPDSMSDEQAATLGVSLATVGQGLYKSLKLPLPKLPTSPPPPSSAAAAAEPEKTYLFIHAASTSVGLYATQCARASGLTVITTSSPRHHALLSRLGASLTLDRHAPEHETARRIAAYTDGNLLHAWDCTGTGASLCAASLSRSTSSSSSSPLYGVINPGVETEHLTSINPAIQGPPRFTLAYDVFGEPYVFRGVGIEPAEDEFAHASMFTALCQSLLEEGVVVPIEPDVNRGGSGLEGVLVGLDELRAGRVSGTKLVYTL